MLQVLDAGGRQVFTRPIARARVLSEPVAFQMVSLLREAIDRGTGAPARSFGAAGPLGGKTGTTDGFADAWFVGFSSSTVVGVWVGFDRPAAIGRDAYGARVALPIWADFMKRIGKSRPPREFTVPTGLHREELCRTSRLKPLNDCPIYTEYLKEGDDLPSKLCPMHSGTLKQVATRAVHDMVRAMGKKIADVLRGN
jgi:membrane carboxypeptidase/penicillin-binding protein